MGLARCTVYVLGALLHSVTSDLVIRKDYLRDLSAYPLGDGGSAFTSPQPGKCNNFNRRLNDGTPTFIMQHHTVSGFNRTIEHFTRIRRHGTGYIPGVSSHFVIDRDGTVQLVVPLGFRAFHAGAGRLSKKSRMLSLAAQELSNLDVLFDYDILHVGRGDMNSWSVGIENVNSGDEPFTKEQIKANIFLCEYLCDKFPSLDPRLMLAHSDWTYRKIDPSPFFPWHEFANAAENYPGQITRNFGVYPRAGLVLKKNPEVIISSDDERNSKVSPDTIAKCQELLRAYGFYISEEETGKVGRKTKGAIFAAHIHFQGPKILSDPAMYTAWYQLANDIDYQANRELLTEFDENLFIILSDCVAQLEQK